jgi:peptide/nickel transport system permease protein
MMEQLLDTLHHLFLPAITLASIYLALYSRMSRASMLDVLGSDYIRTARSKGLNERVVVYKHALKNALLPVVTMAGLQFSQLIAGAVIVETVYSWPGMGQLAFESILRRDHPLLLGILFFSTMIVVIANILTDLSYRLLDPRIK